MEELDLKEIFGIIWEKKKIIVVVTLVLVALAIIYSFIIQTPKYKSTISLILARAENSEDTSKSVTTTDVTLNQKLVSTYSEIVKRKSVLRPVISNLQIANLTEDELKANVTVTAKEDTEVIEITVSNENPEYAAKIANEIGAVFSEKIKEIYKINNVYTLDTAEPSASPYNIKPMKYIMIAFVGGIFISCAFIVVMSLFDTTVKSAEEIERALKTPVISQIPYYDDVIRKGGKKR